MPTVFLIQRRKELRHFQSFLYKTKDSRLKILCSIPDKTAHRTNPHLLQDSNDSTKCLSGASIWDETAKKIQDTTNLVIFLKDMAANT